MDFDTYLSLATVLFTVGALGFLVRRNILIQLMCIEVMLNAVNLSLVVFNRWRPQTLNGQLFAFVVIAVAAAEAAVGLAIVISLFRHKRSVNVDGAEYLKH
ncbi:MAG: NADH-quinone oxidoreductase subunit NuoK [Polyangiales bacterium]